LSHFDSHASLIDKCFSDYVVEDQKRDHRISTLESATATSNSSFDERKPQVEDSIHSIKLELTKLNTYFNRDAKDSRALKPGVLHIESVPERPLVGSAAADGPCRHRVDNTHRDCGFGLVYTQTHDPIKGTMLHSPPPQLFSCQNDFTPSRSSYRSTCTFGQNPRNQLGKLPKIKFPTFEGENPKLWKSHCKNYFEMYDIDSSVWVMVATIHFEEPATRWLQSVDHKVRLANWLELCSWIHDRFGQDQHEILIKHLYHIKQLGSVQDYIDKFCELIDQLQAYTKSVDPLYYTT
jgi:hypothetical protein